MSTIAIEVESSSEIKHKPLARWVEEVAQLCKPDRIHWCDGSPEEYQEMQRLMIQAGVATELHHYPGTFHGSSGAGAGTAISTRMVDDRLAALARAYAAIR